MEQAKLSWLWKISEIKTFLIFQSVTGSPSATLIASQCEEEHKHLNGHYKEI